MADNRNQASDDQNSHVSTHSDGNDQWVIINPASGTADYGDDVRQFADERNYTIQETTHEEHAIQLAQDAAANDVDRLAVAGGGGTLHEVVRGLVAVSALGKMTLGVIPTGTENIFATNIGVASIEEGFDLLDHGKRLQTAAEELEPLEKPDIPDETRLPEQEIRSIVRDEIRRHQQSQSN